MGERAVGKGGGRRRNAATEPRTVASSLPAILADEVDQGPDCRLHPACREADSERVENALLAASMAASGRSRKRVLGGKAGKIFREIDDSGHVSVVLFM